MLCFPGLSMTSWNYVKKRPLVGGLITNGSQEGQLMYYGSLVAERDLVPIEKIKNGSKMEKRCNKRKGPVT